MREMCSHDWNVVSTKLNTANRIRQTQNKSKRYQRQANLRMMSRVPNMREEPSLTVGPRRSRTQAGSRRSRSRRLLVVQSIEAGVHRRVMERVMEGVSVVRRCLCFGVWCWSDRGGRAVWDKIFLGYTQQVSRTSWTVPIGSILQNPPGFCTSSTTSN